MNFGARPAGMAALTVVQRDVDALVDEVLQHLESSEITSDRLVEALRLGVVLPRGADHEGCPISLPLVI